jgi:hypothetical protein
LLAFLLDFSPARIFFYAGNVEFPSEKRLAGPLPPAKPGARGAFIEPTPTALVLEASTGPLLIRSRCARGAVE